MTDNQDLANIVYAFQRFLEKNNVVLFQKIKKRDAYHRSNFIYEPIDANLLELFLEFTNEVCKKKNNLEKTAKDNSVLYVPAGDVATKNMGVANDQ